MFNQHELYAEMYTKDFNEYKNYLEEYNKRISSNKYQEIVNTMPFRFLNAIHLCEQLDLFQKCNPKPKMYFSSLEEAQLFYKNLVTFKKTSDELLENAAYIVELDKLRTDINLCVKDSPYLRNDLCVAEDKTLPDIAKKCVEILPKYPEMITKTFKWNFIESCIICFNCNDLGLMVDNKIIRDEDLDNICLTETINDYQRKVSFLYKYMDKPTLKKYTMSCKLKGVTFPNDDGSSRQENLKELKKYMEENPTETIHLQTQNYTYTPEIGEPEPAIRLLWNNKCIGNLSKTLAAELVNYKESQYEIEMEKLAGGVDENMALGCAVKLTLYKQIKELQQEEILEK